jgi:hypothetical protein
MALFYDQTRKRVGRIQKEQLEMRHGRRSGGQIGARVFRIKGTVADTY